MRRSPHQIDLLQKLFMKLNGLDEGTPVERIILLWPGYAQFTVKPGPQDIIIYF